jgi:hypothetical protein
VEGRVEAPTEGMGSFIRRKRVSGDFSRRSIDDMASSCSGADGTGGGAEGGAGAALDGALGK